MKPNTVPAAGEAMPKSMPTEEQVANAMRTLDGRIKALVHMSDIAAEAFDQYFVPQHRGQNCYTFKLTEHEYQQFGFLMNDVADRAGRLHKAFLAAWVGEETE